ncbi:ankyrin repeat-containing domain protein [Usnea florida]
MSDLIARGANVDYENPDLPGQTPLWNSVTRNSVVAVRLLIEKGANVNFHHLHENFPDYTTYSASFFEIEFFAPQLALKKHTEILRLLLSAGADASALYNTSLTDDGLSSRSVRVNLLHDAARLGASPAVEVLIDHGAKIDLLSPSYGTALMAALLRGTENTVEILLARGANPNININPKKMIDPKLPYARQCRIRLYQTPIQAAIVGGKLSMVELLLKSGVLPSQSTLDFAINVRRRESLYVDSRDVSNNYLILDISGTRDLGIKRIRQDNEIINVLKKALNR